MLMEMKVEGLLFDPRSNMYILLLREMEGNSTLPIWIGKPEADSIALALGKVMTPRPLTHDLFKNLIESLRMKVTRIVITDLLENTYYALIYLTDGKKETPVDSRPSDPCGLPALGRRGRCPEDERAHIRRGQHTGAEEFGRARRMAEEPAARGLRKYNVDA
jgi:bifunctional DNase/RNase